MVSTLPRWKASRQLNWSSAMLKKRKKAKVSQSPPADKGKATTASSTAAAKAASDVASNVSEKILESAVTAPVVVAAASAIAEVASA